MNSMLTAPEWLLEEARRIGRARYRENRSSGRCHTNFRGDPATPALDAYGAFAELCFSEFSGLPIRVKTECPDPRSDVDGWEVKSTVRPLGRLLVPLRDANRYSVEDRIVLIFVDPPRFKIVGWQRAGFFVGVPDKLDETLPSPAYACSQKELLEYPE